MRKMAFLAPAALALALFGSYLPCCTRTAAAEEARQKKATSTFHVTGMTCGGCEVGVEKVIQKLDGVDKVTASYADGEAVVTYDPAKVTPRAIIDAIGKLGYKAELKQPGKAGR